MVSGQGSKEISRKAKGGKAKGGKAVKPVDGTMAPLPGRQKKARRLPPVRSMRPQLGLLRIQRKPPAWKL